MKKILASTIAVLIAASFLTACTNREEGTTGGAVVGGVVGYGLTGGSAVGTAVGAAGGGLIGNAVTR